VTVALTPDDIVGYEFRQQKVRGYDVEQVDDLLDLLADQVERTDRELAELRQQLRDSEARLDAALETESTLKRTLVTAQDAAERALAEAREQADELRENAERAVDHQLSEAREEARRIVAEAQQEARAELTTARQQRAAVEARLDALRELEQRHRDSLQRHLHAQLDQLDQLADDPEAPANSPAPPAGAEASGGGDDEAEHEAVPHGDPAPSEREDRPSSADHGLRVRVRGTEHAAAADQQLQSPPPPNGGDGAPGL
jgi:DivIVA domain-containing protein